MNNQDVTPTPIESEDETNPTAPQTERNIPHRLEVVQSTNDSEILLSLDRIKELIEKVRQEANLGVNLYFVISSLQV